MTINFVSKLKKGEYFPEPFPHWIIDNFFNEDELSLIDNEFPSVAQIIEAVPVKKNIKVVKEQNSVYVIEFNELGCLKSKKSFLNKISDSWINQKKDILNFLSKHDFANRYDKLIFDEKFVEARGDFRSATPAKIEGTTTLGPHLDSSYELLAGLVYLRSKDDNTEGGDLDIYQLKENSPEKYASNQLRIPVKYLKKLKKIKYSYNSAIFFISHPLAIHGISTRAKGKYERRLVNLSLELDSSGELKMFDASSIIDTSLSPKQYKLSFFQRVLRKLGFNVQFKSHKYGRYKWQKMDDL